MWLMGVGACGFPYLHLCTCYLIEHELDTQVYSSCSLPCLCLQVSLTQSGSLWRVLTSCQLSLNRRLLEGFNCEPLWYQDICIWVWRYRSMTSSSSSSWEWVQYRKPHTLLWPEGGRGAFAPFSFKWQPLVIWARLQNGRNHVQVSKCVFILVYLLCVSICVCAQRVVWTEGSFYFHKLCILRIL